MRPEKVSRKTTNLARLILLSLALLASTAFAQNPVPFIDQPLVPSAVAPGGPDFTLTVNGTGFASGATVNWNDTPLATTFVSGSQLTATVPASNIATAGTASITVANPGTAVVSNVVFLTVPASPPPLSFVSPLGPAIPGNGAYSLAVADFNGDGILDLAVAYPESLNVSILLGQGDGTFTPAPGSPVVVAVGPICVVVGDFNGDGKPDLAVASPNTNSVRILLGNGDGTFTATTPLNAIAGGGSPVALAVGDFNGDGKLDLAVPVQAAGVVICLGNGDGTFTTTSVPLAWGAAAIAVGDFNLDSRLDLALVGYNDAVSILLGNGDGTFQAPANYPVGKNPLAIATGDFNGDGKLDLVVANSASNTVSVLLGNGDGTFQNHVDYAAGAPTSVVAADFSGDGRLDLAVPDWYGSSVTILVGAGDGTFAPSPNPPVAVGSEPNSIGVGDFNNDGTLDMAVASYLSGNVPILLDAAAVRLSSPAVTFSDQTVNTTSAGQSVQLINQSNASLNITNIMASGDFAVQASGTTCSSSTPVAVGNSCSINITFTPTALGSRTGTLTVTDDAYNTPQTATLSGNGINPSAVLSPTSLDFGNQNLATTSAAQPVTLTNSGVGTLTIAGIVATGDFAQTNNCGTSVAQGANCTINVTFTPSSPGARTGVLTITDNSSTGTQQTVSLSGTGVPPTVTLSATTLTFGSYGIGITSPAQTVTVSNNGPGPVTVTKVTASGDFAQTNNCVGTIAALASCTISVTFTPTAGGTRAGFVTITDNAVASPQTVTLSGTGAPPTATASPASLSFGNVAVGTTTTAQAVTLANSGPGPLAISSIAVTGANHADFPQTNNCPSSLAASASCTVNVTFKPSLNSAESGTLTIKDNAASNPQTISLSGTGQAPVAGLSPGSLDFPGQTVGVTSAPAAVTLTNSGALALTVSGVLVTSPFVQSNNCPASPATLAAGSSCTITLTFTAAFAGTTFGSLYVSDNSLTGVQQTVSLTGEAAVSFGNQPVGETSAAQAVTVANGSTTTTVTVTGATATGDFAVASNPCGALPPGGSCAPTVTFTPTAPGTRTGALAISRSTGGVLNIPLTGTGLGPSATLSKSSVAFANQFVGTTSAATAITVANNGNQALNFTSIAATGDFSVAASGTTCSTSAPVAASGNCVINVTFTPTAGGARTGAVTITDNASGSPQSVALSGTGEDFTTGAASGSSTSQSVTAGQAATYSLAFTPNGASGTLALSCSGAPTGATCTINPASLSLSGASAADATVTVTTTAKTMTAPVGSLGPPPMGRHMNFPLVLWFMALLAVAAGFSLAFGSADLKVGATRLYPVRPAEKPQSFWKTKLCATSLGVILLLVVIWAACGGGGRSVYPPPPAAGVSLSPSSLTFTSQNMGTTSTAQTVTLTNSGNATLAISGIAVSGANAGDFAETNTCNGAVSAGANCQIKATFSPAATGTRTGSVTITDDATGSPHSVSLSGAGVPPATPPAAYTLTITATLTSSSGTLTHTIPLTLTVN